MPDSLLTESEILSAYDHVGALYPHQPTLSLWRAWELAAYRRHQLVEPVLDIGCGDGRFFRLIFPAIRRVVGVDHDPAAVSAALRTEVYEAVHTAPADRIPLSDASFASAFANCSLEHMDNLSDVLSEIYRLLRPGGRFLFSVVTDKFVTWNPLPMLAGAIGGAAAARRIGREYLDYHHLVNPLSVEHWKTHLTNAGFERIDALSIIPEVSSRVFLFLDALWHLHPQSETGKKSAAEVGGMLESYFARIPGFPATFREIIAALIRMEVSRTEGCGVVFLARRPA